MVLAVAAAGVVLLAVVLLALRGGRTPDFGDGEAMAGVVRASQNHESAAFGPAGATLGESGDGLLAAGFSGFRVPEGLDGAVLRGALVDKTGPAAVAVLRLGDSGLRAAVFPSAPFGVGQPDDDGWLVYELPPGQGAPRLGVAAQVRDGVCFAVSSPDGTPAVRRWLSAHGVKTD